MNAIVDSKNQKLVSDLLKELTEDNLAIFAGAGLSVPAGFVSWYELLRPIAEDLGLDIEKENDLVALAQYHCNSNGSNRGILNQLLIDELSRNARITENHVILSKLPISTYWTTNYDKLIENAITEAGKIPDVKYDVNQLSFTKRGRDAVVYKMHGDVDHPANAVLTKDDYESYHVQMQPFINALSGDLVSKTFLFLGFSFTDPNLDYILSRVRIACGKNQRPHYCILKSIEPKKDESEAETEYRRIKQRLFIDDLKRFGIKTTLVSSYSEITDILRELDRSFKRKTIFISGSAHEYGRWKSSDAENFIYCLAKEISALKFNIVSGFGLGVGSSVITGVLESLYMNGLRLDSNQLILRPFPQTQTGNRSREEVWSDYRNDMISHAGIALFLFGNKLKNGHVVTADGLIKEFEIAKSKGLLLIPVGATGYASKAIYQQLSEEGYFTSCNFPQKARVFIDQICDETSDLNAIKQGLISLLKLFK